MIDPSLLKFFDTNSNFSADAEFISKTGVETDVMPAKIAILGSMTRVEMDMTRTSKRTPSDDAEASYIKDLKTAGAAESVSIFNPDKKCTYKIMPSLKAYLLMPMRQKELDQMKQRPEARRTELGSDKIGNRTCTKYMITFDPNGPMDVWRTWESPRAAVWIALDAPTCPLRLDVLGSDGSTNDAIRCIILFKNIQTGKVDKKLFEPPETFIKCESQEALDKVIWDHWPNATKEERMEREKEAATPERGAAEQRKKEERAKAELKMREIENLADQTRQEAERIKNSTKQQP